MTHNRKQKGANMQKTVAYYRNSISKMKQKLSIEYQMDHVRKKSREKQLLIDEEYTDNETSARKTKTEERKNFSRMLYEVKKGNIQKILVYSRCRLARNVTQYMEIYRLFKEKNIEVIFAAEHEFPMIYTVEGELIERIMAAFNEHEATTLVEKLQDSKKTVARKGKHAVGPITYGYRKDENSKGDWIIDSKEAETIKQLFQAYKKFSFKTNTEFIEMLDNNEITRADGEKWNYGRAMSALSNDIYIGYRRYTTDKETIERFVSDLVIVDKSIWEQVQEKKSQFKIIRKENDDEELIYLLDKLVICSRCHNKVNGHRILIKEEKIPVYRCRKHHKVRAEKEQLELEVIKCANQFFFQILNPTISLFINKCIQDEHTIYNRLTQQSIRKIEFIEERITKAMHRLIESEENVNLPKQIQKDQKELEDLNRVNEEWEEKKFSAIEKLKLVEVYQNNHENGIDKVIDEEMEDVLKLLLLSDIVDSIVLTEADAHVNFKHPHYQELGGRERIELG